MNPLDIYRAIEEILGTYEERRIVELLADKEMSNELLHATRGMAKAARQIRGSLRNTLGYDPNTL
jgi:hypothetical protein